MTFRATSGKTRGLSAGARHTPVALGLQWCPSPPPSFLLSNLGCVTILLGHNEICIFFPRLRPASASFLAPDRPGLGVLGVEARGGSGPFYLGVFLKSLEFDGFTKNVLG